MMTMDWKEAAQRFFEDRAETVPGMPSLDELCFVSGRDPRLWRNAALYDDMIDSIVRQADLSGDTALLEVGCAAGFLARGLAGRVRRYVGVDMAEEPLRVAARLGLLRAEFRREEGGRLSFPSGSFDRAVSYDMITNIPGMEAVAAVVKEMIRVVKPGGRVMVGSIPDEASREAYQEVVKAVGADLDARYGPVPPMRPKSRWRRPSRWLGALRPPRVEPGIVCYYFSRQAFLSLGREMGVATTVHDIHAMNPYFGHRFNVVYTKSAA
jgi:ubiquinone/menaquinone biosynthesis C-methylase UbiE